MTSALTGVRRIRATPPVRRAPLLLDDVRMLLLHLSARATEWPAGVAARRHAARLLGFAGAHRRGELVALTLADLTLHQTDGLHVRLRSSKTDQGAHGAVKALPYGRDPATLRRRPVARGAARLRHRHRGRRPPRGAAGAGPAGRRGRWRASAAGRGRCGAALLPHRPAPERADPTRALFPTVHRSGGIADRR